MTLRQKSELRRLLQQRNLRQQRQKLPPLPSKLPRTQGKLSIPTLLFLLMYLLLMLFLLN